MPTRLTIGLLVIPFEPMSKFLVQLLHIGGRQATLPVTSERLQQPALSVFWLGNGFQLAMRMPRRASQSGRPDGL